MRRGVTVAAIAALSALALSGGALAEATATNFRVTLINGTLSGAGSHAGFWWKLEGSMAVPHLGDASYILDFGHSTGFPYEFNPATGLWTKNEWSTMMVTFTTQRGTLTVSGSNSCSVSGPDPQLLDCDSSVTNWTASGTRKYANYTGSGTWDGETRFTGRIKPHPPH